MRDREWKILGRQTFGRPFEFHIEFLPVVLLDKPSIPARNILVVASYTAFSMLALRNRKLNVSYRELERVYPYYYRSPK